MPWLGSLFILLLFPLIVTAQNEQVITFESANPFGFSDIINALAEQPSQSVHGLLKFPHDTLQDKKYPLIVGVAGSLGWRAHHLDYMAMYRDNGFATFELKSFASRGVTSTVGEQNQVTIAAVILDAYRALEKLAEHPHIDAENVAITGWSLGGGVSLFSGWMPLKEAITNKVSFKAHLAFYPPCFVRPEDTRFTDAPIQLMIGEEDNWTPAAPCEQLVDLLAPATTISFTTFPGAHHGFDSQSPVVQNERGYSFKDCIFDLTADGEVLMNYLHLPMSGPLMQKLGFLFCVERGVTIGGHPPSRAKALPMALAFMQQHLDQ